MQKRVLSTFEKGKTAMFACQYDSRFSYCAYIPSDWNWEDEPRTMIVVVHGSARTPQQYRDCFSEYAEKNGLIVLAPLFPCAITSFDDMSSYKYVSYGGIRFDKVLLAMVDEMGRRYNVRTDRFLMHGFSGGGHFVHRFFYLHPSRLLGLSIGAPGYITVLDDSKPWHAGTKGFEQVFGTGIDLAALRSVPVQLIVGGEDTDPSDINEKGGNWMDELAETGTNRVERIKYLYDNYKANGLNVRLDIVPGVKHWGYSVVPDVCTFFETVLPFTEE